MTESFFEKLKIFLFSRRQDISNNYQRTLPFGDYVVDRWEKARFLNFGEGTSVYDSVLVIGDVHVGQNTWIGPFVVLDGSGGLTIGSNCSISAGVQIYSHDSVDWAIGKSTSYDYAPTKIGNNCYIGPNTVITKGTSIGNRCIVGANSLVLTDIIENSKAVGTPCKIIGKVV
ncbi:acyltransferase [Adonisia turfae]|uniref:Acyltransferase n=1 Tax=Adonisia turfae CCMR0081 TaxID=2292702 RepID=A0A6M0RRS7_9CYAN|nr:acyltransferase [Adonisia turfae]NEZ58819.1 acyltransferase [Adonisia turfae CCMR0081]